MWTHYRQTTLKITFSQPLGEKMQSLSAKLPTLWTDTN